MADLTEIGNFISSLDTQAAAWYRGLTGSPVVTPAFSSQSALSQQIALQQAAQASLLNTNPTLAGIISNPTVMIMLGLGILVLLIFVLKR
jgi:hypothetical protein